MAETKPPVYTVIVKEAGYSQVYGFELIEDLLEWAFKRKESRPKLSKSAVDASR